MVGRVWRVFGLRTCSAAPGAGYMADWTGALCVWTDGVGSAAARTGRTGGDGGDLRERGLVCAGFGAGARGYDQQRSGGQIRGGADSVSSWTTCAWWRRCASGADVSDLTLEDGVRVLTVHASRQGTLNLPSCSCRDSPSAASRCSASGSRRRATCPRYTAAAGDPGAIHLAEEACLFYVGLTRARDNAGVGRAERYGRMRYPRPSQFLAPIRDRLGSTLRVTKWSLQNARTRRNAPRRARTGAGARRGL